jgi:hypothetical protein
VPGKTSDWVQYWRLERNWNPAKPATTGEPQESTGVGRLGLLVKGQSFLVAELRTLRLLLWEEPRSGWGKYFGTTAECGESGGLLTKVPGGRMCMMPRYLKGAS